VSNLKLRGASIPSVATPSLKFLGAGGDEIIDCAAASIAEIDALPSELLEISSDDIRSLAAGFVYEPLGVPALRKTIADRYSSLGVETNPDEVLITTGAQQAVELLFTLFARDRGTILMENPTYVGALDAARSMGAAIVGLITHDGIVDVSDLRDKMERLPARVVYLMTRCQNPTGAVLTAQMCREIAELGEATDTPIVDDMTLSDLAFDGRSRPLLASLSGGNIITIGSLSKLFWPGLRVGWVRASAPIVGRLARLKIVADLGSSHVSQVLAARLVPLIDDFAATRRAQLLERLALFSSALQEQLPTWSFRAPEGGPFVWVRLPQGDGEVFAATALTYGVQVLPGARMSPDVSTSEFLRVSYVAKPDVLRAAVARLADAWGTFADGSPDRMPLDVVV